jgi:phosphoglycerate dehydrogenase-like enzyme
MRQLFKVGVTRDFLRADGSPGFGDIGLGLLDAAPGVAWEYLAENTPELRPDQIAAYDGLLVLAPRVSAATLEGSPRVSVVARFGVGFDSVDLEACTRVGAAVTITPDGVRRPVAAAIITLTLALAHRLFDKDRITRAGRWAEKLDYMGMGVTGRTLGLVGFGNIGREACGLARALDLRVVTADPYASPQAVAEAGAELLDLETLLRRSDFVAVCCALSDATHHLINAERLATMKRSAYLINVARGPIVDQAALTAALASGQLRGAGIDVFEQEPVDPADPLLKLENVILSPHAICWTDECFYGNGASACRSLLDAAAGRAPSNVVNREVLSSPPFLTKLAAFQSEGSGA